MRSTPRRLATVIAAGFLALAAAAALAGPAGADTAKVPPAGTAYAALGESGAAGPLLPGAPTGSPACLQTSINYPHLLADALHLDLDDISCSGAVTQDGYTPQQKGGVDINPAQLSAVTRNTKLVTFDFGSNNIKAAALYTRCLDTQSSCKDFYTQGGTDQYQTMIDQARQPIGDLIKAIKAKAAPGARILVVSRLQKIRPGGCTAVPVRPQDATYIDSVIRRLNGVLQQQANANGATYIDMYTPSSKGHDMCGTVADRWTEPYVPVNPAAPIHSNQLGHQKIEAAIAAALRNG